MMKKRFIAIVLTLLMILSVIPVDAYAENTSDAWDVNAMEQEMEQIQEETDEVGIREETSDSGIKAAAKSTYLYRVDFDQEKENDRNLKVTIPNLSRVLSDNAADTFKVTAKMYYGDQAVQSKSASKALSEIDADSKSFTVELPAFGKYKVSGAFYKGKTLVSEADIQTVGITAEKYNIVPLNATTPVLIYSLKVFEDSVSKTEDGEPIPSIVTLSRAHQYDWDQLPENVYANPLLTKEENASSNWKNVKLAKMKAYVKELYELNPDSEFVFYLNDYNLQQELPQVVYENKLPEDQYSLRIITDGSASYKIFQEAYGSETDAQAKHDKLVESFKKIKQDIYDGKTFDYTKLEYGNIYLYTYAILDAEKDAQWWVVRKSSDTFGIQDETFQSKFLADERVTSNYINNLLASVQEMNKENEFKSMYKFDDSMFEATRKKGKKIMMILGTSKAVETANPISPYCRFVMAYYGDEFEYYYKGHPGHLPEQYPDYVANMDSLGMQMLDSSIAAELYAFYDPDIYLSGYSSTTFVNSGSEERNGGLFNVSKADAYVTGSATVAYADQMDFFMSDLTKNPDAADEGMKAAAAEFDKDDKLYLVEFNDTDEYDTAIWNASTSIIYFYKKNADETYNMISSRDALKAQTITTKAKSYTYVNKKSYDFSKNVSCDGTGRLSYASSNKKVFTVDSKTGKIKTTGSGKATLTIKASATGISKEASKKVTIYVKPAKQKITYYKSTAKKNAVIKWTKDSSASGYQLVLATNSKFTKNKKVVTIKSYKTYKKTVTKLKSKKTYYVKVRAYKTISNKKYYGEYSAVKKVKIK